MVFAFRIKNFHSIATCNVFRFSIAGGNKLKIIYAKLSFFLSADVVVFLPYFVCFSVDTLTWFSDTHCVGSQHLSECREGVTP